MYKQRYIIESGRIVNTLETNNGFFIIDDSGTSIGGFFYSLDDVRFSKPFDRQENKEKTILELINEERQKAYLMGLSRGLKTARQISHRHFENHKLLHPKPPEDLKKWDNLDIIQCWDLPVQPK